MKTSFDVIFPELLTSEGGFADNPKDPGGATYKGITLSGYQRNVDPKTTVSQLKALTDDQIKAYYKTFYWDTVKGDLLPAGIDYSVFDFGVNSGQATAVRKLQGLVGTSSDGIVGNATLAAVANKSQAELIEDYNALRLAYVKSLPTFATFGTGWTARIQRVEQTSQKLLSGNVGVVGQVLPVTVSPVDQSSNTAVQLVGNLFVRALVALLKKVF